MCGIAGSIRLNQERSLPEDCVLVTRLLDQQRHRGPDADGLYQDGPVTLGHLRLAILDLSPAGRQPMSNETGDVWVVYNGEIYNYQELRSELAAAGHHFRSQSDTEVILHGYEEWGMERMLQRLRGMFAIALYDARKERRKDGSAFVFLARDRVGIKPLYYTRNADRLVFASEVQALKRSGACSPQLDETALTAFLCFGSVPAPQTWLRDARCLPAGSFLALGRSEDRVTRYWDLSYQSAASAEPNLGPLVQDTVERHLLSDVPLGIFLSGGLDSAGLVSMASRRRQTGLITLTVTFEEEEFSEAPYARAFGACFHTEHHEVKVRDQDFLDEMPKILRCMDQPTADGVNTYFVARAARQLGLTVVLSGLGGDEAFLGYPHYRNLLLKGGPMGRYTRFPDLLRKTVGFAAGLYGRAYGQERWQRFDYLRGRPIDEGLYLLARGFFAPAQVAELMDVDSAVVERAVDASFAPVENTPPNGHFNLNRFHSFEMKRYLHDQLLRDSDVFSMAHSLELRVPYLDHELLESCCRIPARDKVSADINKPKLVEALDHPMLEEAGRRKKQGFTFPFARWMKTHHAALEERALSGGVLSPKAVRQCWRQFREGRLHWSRAWATAVIAAMTGPE